MYEIQIWGCRSGVDEKLSNNPVKIKLELGWVETLSKSAYATALFVFLQVIQNQGGQICLCQC
jgi:hypothetical protein